MIKGISLIVVSTLLLPSLALADETPVTDVTYILKTFSFLVGAGGGFKRTTLHGKDLNGHC